MTEKKYSPQEKYMAANTKQYKFRLNLKYDSDIIEFLDNVDNKQGLIKELLRERISKGEKQ